MTTDKNDLIHVAIGGRRVCSMRRSRLDDPTSIEAVAWRVWQRRPLRISRYLKCLACLSRAVAEHLTLSEYNHHAMVTINGREYLFRRASAYGRVELSLTPPEILKVKF